MKSAIITCLIAYAVEEHTYNVKQLINHLAKIPKHLNKECKVRLRIYIGWNSLGDKYGSNVIESFEYDTSDFSKHISLHFRKIKADYKHSTKAYFTWGHLLKKVKKSDYYFFFKDNYFKRLHPKHIIQFFNVTLLENYDIIYQEVVKNIHKDFHLKKIAYKQNDSCYLFPRTQLFMVNKKVLEYLLEKDFFFSNEYQKKQRQYDLMKIVIHRFNNFTFKLRTVDDIGDKHTIKMTNNVVLEDL